MNNDLSRNSWRHALLGALCVPFALMVFSCSSQAQQPETKQEFIYSTVISLTVYDAKNNDVFTRAFDRLRDIDDKMSAQKPDSEISQVSAQAGVAPVHVSSDTYTVMKRALDISKISGGIFDPTIGPIVDLWNVAGDKPHVASDAELAKVRPLVDWHQVVLDDAKQTIYLKKKGMKLDFGGIAKGYAADIAAGITKEEGIKSAILSMGDSSIYLIGSKPDGSKWRVGIQNPEPGPDFEVDRGKLLGVVECSDAIVETSGPYERFFVQDGKRYHHIMDPRTGKPAESGLQQVTLVMPSGVDLPDGISTTSFIKGLDDGMKFVEGIPGVAAIFVTDDKKVYVTKNLGSQFTLTDQSFTLITE